MLTYLKLAWRNLLRNKRRTLIAGTALGLGLASMIFTDALIVGVVDNMVGLATGTFMGQAQIMDGEFRMNQEIERTVAGYPALLDSLRAEPAVAAASPRVLSLAMATSPANVSAVTLVGVDPQAERPVSKFDEAIVQGDYFAGDDLPNIVIGVKLAELLEVGLGDRLVLTTSQARSGDLSQELFRVSGIFDLGDRNLNSGLALVRLPRAQAMLGIGDNIHQIAVDFTSLSFSRDTSLAFWRKYSADGNVALSWAQLMPQLQAYIDISGISLLFVIVILIGLVTFVILNTLFMSIFERMFEFGVLRALGTRPSGVATLIMLEAGCLGLVSIVIGAAIGFLVTGLVSLTGLDYSGTQALGLTFRELIFPVFRLRQFVFFPIWVLAFTLLIAIYPAAHAARIAPAQAMRKSF